MSRPWDGWSFGDLEAAEDAYQHDTIAPLEEAVEATEAGAEIARRQLEDALLDTKSLCRIHELNIRSGVASTIDICDGCLDQHYEDAFDPHVPLERCGCGCGAYGDPRYRGEHAAKCLEPESVWKVTGCTCPECSHFGDQCSHFGDPRVTSADSGGDEDGERRETT